MTEAVNPIESQSEKEKLFFLDLDEGQFGTVVFLSSAGAQMNQFIGSERMRDEMLKVIQSGKYTTVEEALAWVRAHRNNLLQLNGASSFAMSLLSQVEDLIIDRLLGVNSDTQQEETK
uniref:Tail assembly chaperone n=1 Tax=Salmonella phage vB_SEnST11_KE23 TaxID=3161174 RepID=A0AAU8GHR2_9CAUD